MTLSDYSQLIQQVKLSVAARESQSSVLQSLKEFFREGINSVRRFEKINTIGQLLQVLELRDIISEENVVPLKTIAREIKSRDLLSKIIEYEETHESRDYVNYYGTEKANKPASSEIFINPAPSETGMSKKKKDRIFLTVTEEIGSSWRDLARNLRIREYQIDEIDSTYKTLYTKAHKMLEQFDLKKDPQKWYFVLCEALERIRRKDLKNSVQEIIMMNI